MSTIFSKIIEGDLPCDKVFENEHVIAFKDIAPVAPIHILLVPKKEIKDLQSLGEEDFFILGEVTKVAQILAKELDVEDGYRLLTNNGPGAGQTIFHLHFHFIAGRPFHHLA
ncbi:MAG: histidine triad nucleotide-binding protein [Chlamydiae bacterium]|jgi:histidine triad (HIT) family protein|nr:histidine triad nucleotide-binding protein [Chlamydiota bacterium]